MGTIKLVVVLKHEHAVDNLSDLVLNVSGESFSDIESTVVTFVKEYNISQQTRGNPTLYDWYIGNRQDMVEVFSCEGMLELGGKEDEDE